MPKKSPFTLPLVGDVFDFVRLLATAVAVVVGVVLVGLLAEWLANAVGSNETLTSAPGLALGVLASLSDWIGAHWWQIAGYVFGWLVLHELRAARRLAEQALEQGAQTLSIVRRLEQDLEAQRARDDGPSP